MPTIGITLPLSQHFLTSQLEPTLKNSLFPHTPAQHANRTYAMLVPAVNFTGTLTTRSNIRVINLPVGVDVSSVGVGYMPPGAVSLDAVRAVLIVPSGSTIQGNIAWALEVQGHKANQLFTDSVPLGTSPFAIPSEDPSQDYLYVVTPPYISITVDVTDTLIRFFVRRKATDIIDTFSDSVYFAGLQLLLTLDQ